VSLEYRFENRGTVNVRSTEGKRSFCWHIFITTILLLAGLVAWLFFSGYLTSVDSEGGLQVTSLRGKMNEQERLLDQQARQLVVVENEAVSAKRSQKIQETANEKLRRELVLAEGELVEARQKLLLYESILSPEDLEPGLHVQHFGLKRRLVDAAGKKVLHDRLYQYHLVLALIRNDKAVSGGYVIEISGKENGKKKTYKHTALLPEGETARDKFSLKYYQSLEGGLHLPEGFVPGAVKVKVNSKAGKVSSVTKKYDWSTFAQTEKPQKSESAN